MKFVLATALAAAAFSLAPAFAQEASPPKADDGAVKVEGVKPSKVLGAIDTSKLVDQDAPPASVTRSGRTTTITTIEPAPEQKTMVNIPSVKVPLPEEVANVASRGNGKYSTKDLVNAQLTAMNNAPPVQQPVINTTTITYPPGSRPDSSAGASDEARTADTTDLPPPQPTPGGF